MAQLASIRVLPSGDDPARMIGVDDAREQILAAFAPLPAVGMPIADSLGLVLATDVYAPGNVPPFANAAMDGFAVRAIDTVHASEDAPARLRVVGQAAAGHLPDRVVGPGDAIRIMTGAPVPAGADAVVRFEETDEATRPGGRGGFAGSAIAIYHAARPGANIRLAGEDVRTGERVLVAGTRLRPAEIGLLASIGRATVAVHRRPRVAILATGDEVVPPGAALGPGQIRDSNSAAVAALVRRTGGEPVGLGIARDTIEGVRAKLWAAAGADLLVSTGGVSVGDYDLVKQVLCQEGRVTLWQVRLKPGKPLAFGWIGGTPLVGLPGNPVAAMVAFEQFVRPAILRLLGRTDLVIPTVLATLADRVENRGGRRHFARVRVEATDRGYVAHLAGPQGAGVLTSLVRADGLLVVPETVAVAEPGTTLPVQMIDWEPRKHAHRCADLVAGRDARW